MPSGAFTKAQPSDTPRGPYIGPRSFARTAEDRERFFGRDKEIEALIALIAAEPLVILSAESGAGKTSISEAGLSPNLGKADWYVLPRGRVSGPVHPGVREKGGNPYAFCLLSSLCPERDASSFVGLSLMQGLDRLTPRQQDSDGEPLRRLLIIDQAEEIFTFYPEGWIEGDRRGFFTELGEALRRSQGLHVLVIIRDDFMAKLSPFARMLPGELRAHFHLERLRHAQARDAIEKPLLTTIRHYADGVPQRIVEDLSRIRVQDEAGATKEIPGPYVEPVQLQLVCDDLWHKLPDDVVEITVHHWERYGNVDHALQQFYEAVLRDCIAATAADEDHVRSWFETRLITPGRTRGLVFRQKSNVGGLAIEIVDYLERRHLLRAEMRSGGRWYELTHDRLIGPILNSNAPFNARKEAEREARARELDRARRWRRLLVRAGVLTGALVAMLGWIAFDHNRAHARAEEEEAQRVDKTKKELENARRVAKMQAAATLRQAMERVLGDDPELGVLLAREGLRRGLNEREFREGQWRAAQRSRLDRLYRHDGAVHRVVFSPSGMLLATASEDNTARIFRTDSDDAKCKLVHNTPVRSVAFVDEGTVVTVDHDDTLSFWRVDGCKKEASRAVNHRVEDVAVARAGWLATLGDEAATSPVGRLWKLSTTNPTGEMVVSAQLRPQGPIQSTAGFSHVAISPDQQWIVGILTGQLAQLWSSDGVAIKRLEKDILWPAVTSAQFGRHSKRLAVGFRNYISLWSNPLGASDLLLSHDAVDVAFGGANDDLLVVAAADGSLATWRISEGAGARPLIARAGPRWQTHAKDITSVAASPDGETIATSSSDGSVYVWAMDPDRAEHSFRAPNALYLRFLKEDDQLVLLNSGIDMELRGSDGKRVRSLPSGSVGFRGVPSHDGSRFFGVTYGGAVIVDPIRNRSADRFQCATAEWKGVNTDLRGERICFISRTTAHVCDVRSRGSLGFWDEKATAKSGPLADCALSADGKFLTVIGSTGVAVFDIDTGKEHAFLPGEWEGGDFLSDGRTVVVRDRSWRVFKYDINENSLMPWGELGRATSVDWSVDEQTILTSQTEGIVRVISINPAQGLPLEYHAPGDVVDAVISMSGRHFAVLSEGAVNLYSPDKTRQRVERRVKVADTDVRRLTDEECTQYLGIPGCEHADLTSARLEK
jgi:WD40 repeat protein